MSNLVKNVYWRDRITTVVHSRTGLFEVPDYLNYSPVKKFEEAALRYAEQFAETDPRGFVKLDVESSVPYLDEFTCYVSVRGVDWKWREIGCVSFARNYYTPDDRIYETREVVDCDDGKNTRLLIFGRFKRPSCAVTDLLKHGNFSHDGRKAIEEW